MKLRFPNILRLGRVIVALRQMCWRDPLLQVRGLLGGLLVLGIFGHYVWPDGPGENKNETGGVRLFAAGKNWGTEWQPVIPFSTGRKEIETDLTANPDLDFRALASSAAGRQGWHYLSPATRQQIASLRNRISRISIAWSGTAGGDAAALEWYHENILDMGGGIPGDFIIGNGHRSGDGRIEPSRHWLTGDRHNSPETIVCLVGLTQIPTPAQAAALGELIAALEARSGRVELGVHQAKTTGLLAGP